MQCGAVTANLLGFKTQQVSRPAAVQSQQATHLGSSSAPTTATVRTPSGVGAAVSCPSQPPPAGGRKSASNPRLGHVNLQHAPAQMLTGYCLQSGSGSGSSSGRGSVSQPITTAAAHCFSRGPRMAFLRAGKTSVASPITFMRSQLQLARRRQAMSGMHQGHCWPVRQGRRQQGDSKSGAAATSTAGLTSDQTPPGALADWQSRCAARR